jgi:small subunit ribosomal protein S8
MTMTDPIADMLTRLPEREPGLPRLDAMPSSKLKTHIAEILQQEGYIAGWTRRRGRAGRQPPARSWWSTSSTAPTASAASPASGAVSKPGLRVYAEVRPRCPRCSAASGWPIISTSTGLLTDRQANKKGVGGEVLAYVW